MTEIRHDFRVDVTAALPAAAADGPVEIAVTLIADPEAVGDQPQVVIGIPGGTYHRRYWDLRPPGRTGYSQAAWLAARGVVFIACDYLGGGDSSRPTDADFMTLEVCADAAHEVYQHVRTGLEKGTLTRALPALVEPLRSWSSRGCWGDGALHRELLAGRPGPGASGARGQADAQAFPRKRFTQLRAASPRNRPACGMLIMAGLWALALACYITCLFLAARRLVRNSG